MDGSGGNCCKDSSGKNYCVKANKLLWTGIKDMWDKGGRTEIDGMKKASPIFHGIGWCPNDPLRPKRRRKL